MNETPRLALLRTVVGGPSNNGLSLRPAPSPGRGVVEFDFPGVEVGTAEYTDGPTGATVIYLPKGARTAVDARGGAVGMSGGYTHNHAICFAGGSVYGMSAVAGVAEELLARAENRSGWLDLQEVSGAVIYDFSVRDNSIYPDAALGRAALRNAQPGRFPIGRCGAGCSASAGKVDYRRTELTGQGAAFRQVGAVKVLAASVPNPVGVIVDRDGTVVRGNYDADAGTRRLPVADYVDALASGTKPTAMAGNTTLTVVVTNVRLADSELDQFAKQVHGSVNRAIQPFHTARDGDVLFALTTDEVELSVQPESLNQSVTPAALGAVAAEVVWDAVLVAAR